MARPTRFMKPTMVYMTYKQIDDLCKLSVRTRVPQAVYLREAVDLLLNKYAEILQRETDEPVALVIKN